MEWKERGGCVLFGPGLGTRSARDGVPKVTNVVRPATAAAPPTTATAASAPTPPAAATAGPSPSGHVPPAAAALVLARTRGRRSGRAPGWRGGRATAVLVISQDGGVDHGVVVRRPRLTLSWILPKNKNGRKKEVESWKKLLSTRQANHMWSALFFFSSFQSKTTNCHKGQLQIILCLQKAAL